MLGLIWRQISMLFITSLILSKNILHRVIIWCLKSFHIGLRNLSHQLYQEFLSSPPVTIEIRYLLKFLRPICIFAYQWNPISSSRKVWRYWEFIICWRFLSWSLYVLWITLFLFDFKSLNKKLIDVLWLLIAKIWTKILHKFDDSMLAEVFICITLKDVVGGHLM